MKKPLCLISILFIFVHFFGCTNGKFNAPPCVGPLPSGIFELTTELTQSECPFKYMFRTNTGLVALGDGNTLLKCGYHEVYDMSHDTNNGCDMFTTSYLTTGAEFIYGDGTIYFTCLSDLKCTEYYKIEIYPWTTVEE